MNAKEVKKESGEMLGIVRRLWESKGKTLALRLAMPAAYFFSGLFGAQVSVVGGALPFGAALICSARGLFSASAALAGAVLGSISIGRTSLWQIGIFLLAYCARLAVSFFAYSVGREKKSMSSFLMQNSFKESLKVRLVIVVAVAAALGIVNILYGTNLYSDIFSAAAGFALYPAFTYAFYLVGAKSENRAKRVAGLCGVAYALVLVLRNMAFPFNIGIIAAFAATLFITYGNGMTTGAAFGVFCGMALEPEYAPIYPLAAFAAGTVMPYSPSVSVIAAGAAGLCWAVRVGGFFGVSDVFPELIFACAVCTPLVNMGIYPKREIFSSGEIPALPNEKKGDYIYGRLERLSDSFESISKLLFKVSDKVQRPTLEEAGRICSSAEGKFCTVCHSAAECGKDKAEFFRKTSDILQKEGVVTAGIVPRSLASRCINLDSILSYVNTSSMVAGKLASETCRTKLFASDYKAIAGLLRQSAVPDEKRWMRDKVCERDIREKFAAMGVDFAGISVYGERNRTIYLRGMALPSPAGENDIRETAERIVGGKLSSPDFTIDGSNISVVMKSVPKIKIDVGRYSSSGVPDNFSGDTVSSFENDDGYYYSLVSDGMGSGREAALTSGVSSLFLENLLMAGAPLKASLELLNSFICGGDGECFTTVDLMETDLFTGKTSFIKSGAAPSFVLREGKVFRLHSKTVPVGIIRALDSEVISFSAMAGDRIVMVSDGVTGSYESCPWLYEMLEGEDVCALSPAQAAKLIGQAAERETGRSDDITVAVMKVEAA